MSRTRHRLHYPLVAVLSVVALGAGSGVAQAGRSASTGLAAAAAGPNITLHVVNPLTLQALGLSDEAPATGELVTAEAQFVAQAPVTLQEVTIGVRDSAGNNYDFADTANFAVGTSQTDYTATESFSTPGAYTYFAAYELNGAWTQVGPTETFTVSAGTGPDGPAGSWTPTFSDAFPGTSVDTAKWGFVNSSAESQVSNNPVGTGNPGNQQLEFDQPGNCSVAGGVLTITAKRQSVTSDSGTNYSWTSCMLTSTYAFQYGYIEERAQLPAPTGFWPSMWTWSTDGSNNHSETDAYEFYSVDHTQLFLTQHGGAGGSCDYRPPFDPSAGYHVYGVDIEATGTTWYIDGKQVCTAAGTSTGNTNILLNDFVYSIDPPAAGTNSATEKITYVRAWQH